MLRGDTLILFVTYGAVELLQGHLHGQRRVKKENGRKREERLKSMERSCCSDHCNYVMSRSDIQEVTCTPTVLLLAQKLLDQQW